MNAHKNISLYQRLKPVGSGFFDRPVKQVESPVKFSLVTKRHLSTNRNIRIYFVVKENSYKKKTVLTNHNF